MAPRVQFMYAVLWIPLRKACIPTISMHILLWCPGFPLHFASFGLGGGCWGTLAYVCNVYPVAKEGIDVISVFVIHYVLYTLQLCCMVSLLSWLLSCFPCPLLCDLVPTSWVINFLLVILPIVVLMLPYLDVFAVHNILTFVWLWWQVPCLIPIYFQPLPMGLSSHLCLDQHVYMLRMHLCMPGQPFLGDGSLFA